MPFTLIEIQQAVARAVGLLQQGRAAEAEELCRRVLADAPGNVAAMQVLGVMAMRAGRHDEAIEVLSEAVRRAPGEAALHDSLSQALRKAGRDGEAVEAARRAVEMRPELPELRFNLGNVLRDAGDVSGAMGEFRWIVGRFPEHTSAWFNLGMINSGQGFVEDAVRCFERAVELNPRHGNAWAHLAQACVRLWRLDQAERGFRMALSQLPREGEVHGLFANVLLMRGRVEEAIAEYRIARELSPDHATIASNYLYALNFSDRLAAEEICREHRRWGEEQEARIAPMSPRVEESSKDLRRIGYVSADFRDHAVWRWLEPILRHHDRSRFEIFCYSAVEHPDEQTKVARSLASAWREIGGLNPDAAAEMIREDGIDILVDLGGHTSHLLPIFVRRPAPVQVSYLGYPNSTGLKRIDYLISDEHLAKKGTVPFFSERLVRMAGCFSCYQPIADAPGVNDLRATNGRVTFGSFNNLSKLSPTAIGLFAKVLQAVPSSSLLLKPSGPTDDAVRRDVSERLAAEGIERSRIEVIGRQATLAGHLAVYHRVDIALDSYPYHGTTTTADALWMGVPVVSLAGDEHRSRVGVSLLNAVGLGHLVALTADEFVRIAVELAADLPALAQTRAGLREQVRRSPLTDAPAFAAKVEAAYQQMWHERGRR